MEVNGASVLDFRLSGNSPRTVAVNGRDADHSDWYPYPVFDCQRLKNCAKRLGILTIGSIFRCRRSRETGRTRGDLWTSGGH